jgi:hypothetical protein
MRDARGTSRVPQRRLRRSILRSRSRAPDCIAVVDAVLALDEPYRGTLLMRFFDDLRRRRSRRRAGCRSRR